MADEPRDAVARTSVAEFVRGYEPYVRGLAVRLAPYPAEADDIAQEALIVAFKKLSSQGLDLRRDVRPWLATVVRNLSRRAWDAAIRENKLKHDALSKYVEQLAGESSELYEEAQKAALRDCVEKLPRRSAELLNLRYNLGLRSKCIAEHISSTAEAVRMALVRIRQKLKGCVEEALRRSEA